MQCNALRVSYSTCRLGKLSLCNVLRMCYLDEFPRQLKYSTRQTFNRGEEDDIYNFILLVVRGRLIIKLILIQF
jgi:hypothetical protein